jgi:DNA polymerase alpha subunit A
VTRSIPIRIQSQQRRRQGHKHTHCVWCVPLQVALRRRAAGKRDGVMAGETVPYIICVRTQPGSSNTPATADAGSAEQAAASPVQQEQQQQLDAAASPQQQQGQEPTPAAGSTPNAAAAGHSSSPAAAAAAGGVRAVTPSKSSSGGGIAERAHHPDELRSDPSLAIDAEYYLAQQVLPVVMRLCAPIEVRGWGTCLRKFQA